MGDAAKSSTRLMLFTLSVYLLVSGCTGTEITVKPDPAALQVAVSKKCGDVAVKETTPAHVYPPAGNLVTGFASALEKSGLFERVYYPSRPDDKVNLTLDAGFDVTFDGNIGSNMVKSFFTGFTLFILEPVFWYNFDYNLTGHIDIKKDTERVGAVNASTDAEMSAKFLSLGDAANLEGETLAKAKDSLYKQLLIELDNFCKGR